MDAEWFLYFLTFFTFTAIFSFCYIRHVFTFFERNRILSATYPGFPFGNFYDVVFQKTPIVMQLWKFYNRFKKKKCKFGGFYVFLKPALLIMDSRLINMVLSTNSDYFQDVNNQKRCDFNDEFSQKILFNVAKTIQCIWSKTVSQFEDGEVNFTHVMNNNFVDSAIEEYFDVKNFESLKKRFSEFDKRSVFFSCKKLIFMCYPKIQNVFRRSERRHFIFYKNILENILQDRKKNDVKKSDVLEIFQDNARSINKTANFFLDFIYNLKYANNLLLFALYELCLNKEIQEDLRGEIVRFKKNKSTYTYGELSQLTYLDCVICETFRKYPLKPFVYKICNKEYSGNNFKVPKDVLVFIPLFSIHHDAQNYINPELFDPDRFSEENEKFIDSDKYLPFGNSSKTDFECLALKLLMKTALIELLAKFEITLGRKSPKYIRFDEGFFELRVKDDMWLNIKKTV